VYHNLYLIITIYGGLVTIEIWLLIRLLVPLALIRVLGSSLSRPFHSLSLSLGVIGIRSHLTLLLLLLLLLLLVD
jgi:hypothetical protein